MTPLEFAAALAERLDGRARWVQSRKTWYRTDNRGYWSPEVLEGTLRDATELALELQVPATLAALISAIGVCRGDSGLATAVEEFDDHPWMLGVENGVVDLRTGVLGPHDPALLLTNHATAPYELGAEAPEWRANVLRLCDGRADQATFLQEAVGMALVGDGVVKEHGFFYLLGPAGNGKSAFLRVLASALGSGHVAVLQPSDLTETDRHLAWMMKLRDARLAVLFDIPTRLSTAKLRDLSGGDSLTANHMRCEDETWEPTHTLFVGSNNPPTFGRNTQGMARRYRPIQTGEGLAEKMDGGFERRVVAEEGAGILSWAVEGCLAWQADRKLPVVQGMATQRDAHISDSNPVDEWVADRLEVVPTHGPDPDGAFVTRNEVRMDYAAWRLDQSMPAAREADFIDLFNELRRLDGVREGQRRDPPARGFRRARLKDPSAGWRY